MDTLNTTISDKIVAQYVHLARKIARKYAVPGHVILGFDDLYQELQMCLVRCANSAREKQIKEDEVYYYVSTALSNAAKYLLGRAYGNKRKHLAVELDLSDEVARLPSGSLDSMYERIMLSQIRELLSGVTLSVYDAILNPSDEIIRMAQIDTLRKAHVKRVNNTMVRGASVVRITPELIRRALGITREAYAQAVESITLVARAIV